MNVLLISVQTADAKGGIAVWTEHYLNCAAAQGIHCTLVNTATVGERAHNLTAKRSLKDEWVRTRRIMKDLTKTLRSSRYDVAHLNSSIGVFGIIRDYLLAKKIAKKKIPLVVHFHCDVPFWVTNGVVRYFLNKTLQISDKALVLCENSRRYLQENFSVDAVKIPNFIDEEVIVEEKTIADRIEKILFVGRVSLAKGALEIYELAKRFPDVDFELVGEMSEEAAEWCAPENLHHLGPKPHAEVLGMLDDADIFLFPSHSEGFSLALTEAMARGIPSIATDVGANADMLDGGCGIVVDKEDIDAMEAAIHQLASADVRREMSRSAVQKVKNTYTTDIVVKGMLAEYAKRGCK